MKDMLCIDGGHSHHQLGVDLVGFHAIILAFKTTVIKIKKSALICLNRT